MNKIATIIGAVGILLTAIAAFFDGDPSTSADLAGAVQGLGVILAAVGLGKNAWVAKGLEIAAILAAKHGNEMEKAAEVLGTGHAHSPGAVKDLLKQVKRQSQTEQLNAGVHDLVAKALAQAKKARGE